MQQKRILLVKDDPADSDLTLLTLEKAHVPRAVDVVREGAELVDYLFGTGRYRDRDASRRPNVILLDLKLPRLTGLQVLQLIRRVHLQQHEVVPPVIVWRLPISRRTFRSRTGWEPTATSASRLIFWGVHRDHPARRGLLAPGQSTASPVAGSASRCGGSIGDSCGGTRRQYGLGFRDDGVSTEGQIDGQAPAIADSGRLTGGRRAVAT